MEDQMDENVRKLIEEASQRTAADLQKAMEKMNQKMDEEFRKAVESVGKQISEDLKEMTDSFTRRQDSLHMQFIQMEKMLGNLARHMGLPEASESEVEEVEWSKELQRQTSKGKGVCTDQKEKTPMASGRKPGQTSGTIPRTKVQVVGQTHENSFIPQPTYSSPSYPSYSTTPQANFFLQQQYQQPQFPRQQYPRPQTTSPLQFTYPLNLTSPITNTSSKPFQFRGPRPQDVRPFQNLRPKGKFTEIPISYASAYAQLREQGMLAPSFTEQITGPPFPNWYNPEESCVYHNGVIGHDIENCVALKHKIEHFLQKGFIVFDKLSVRQNPLPQHDKRQVNMIEEDTPRTFEHLIAPIESFLIKSGEDRSLQKKSVKRKPSQQPQMVNTSQAPWFYGIHRRTANISDISSVTRNERFSEEEEGTSREGSGQSNQ